MVNFKLRIDCPELALKSFQKKVFETPKKENWYKQTPTIFNNLYWFKNSHGMTFSLASIIAY